MLKDLCSLKKWNYNEMPSKEEVGAICDLIEETLTKYKTEDQGANHRKLPSLLVKIVTIFLVTTVEEEDHERWISIYTDVLRWGAEYECKLQKEAPKKKKKTKTKGKD